MKFLIIASLILCLPFLALAQKSRKAFAYDFTIDDLPNGLRVVTVPTDARWRMRPECLPDALLRAERAGRKVVAVVASAGSTASSWR